MEQKIDYSYLLVGAGIVGLATARFLLEREPTATIILLEAENDVARHQTSHNSGVVHAGIYYKPGSLKAQLCREGMNLTRDFCLEKGLGYHEFGKVIVAKTEFEVPALEKLIENAKHNGVDFEVWEREELAYNEPNVLGVKALFSPKTAAVDYEEISLELKNELQTRGVRFEFDFKVSSVSENEKFISVCTKDGRKVNAKKAIFCAGLQADRVASLAGIEHGYRVVPFKGVYYEVFNRVSDRFIYPVPDPSLPFLGVHYTIHSDGSLSVGPNASLALSRSVYKTYAFNTRDALASGLFRGFWKLVFRFRRAVADELKISLSRRYYLRKVGQLVSGISSETMSRKRTFGIRAQVVDQQGKAIDDFLFLNTKRSLHVLNAPSPAATAAFAIGKLIVNKLGDL